LSDGSGNRAVGPGPKSVCDERSINLFWRRNALTKALNTKLPQVPKGSIKGRKTRAGPRLFKFNVGILRSKAKKKKETPEDPSRGHLKQVKNNRQM